VTVPANGPVLKKLGLVVWLKAHEEVIWERVSRNNKRPLLLTESPRETVRTLLEARSPMYEAVADMTVDTTVLTHAEVAERIARGCGGGVNRRAQRSRMGGFFGTGGFCNGAGWG